MYIEDQGGCFSRIKWQGRETDHSHLEPKLEMIELYIHSPLHLYGVLKELSRGITLPLFYGASSVYPEE
jgi:hypothetical protein